MKALSSLIIAFSSIIAVHATDDISKVPFSGVYNPTCKYGLEAFAGAWLMHAKRFTKPKILQAINRISFIEAHTFFVALGDGRSIPTDSTCADMSSHVLMTRDYFDFFVEHMSSTLNIAESDDIYPILLNRTLAKTSHLKAAAIAKHSKIRYFHDVVVVIPFALTSGLLHSPSGVLNQKIRLSFFESTFWSIFRYFPNIIVSVTRERGYEGLMSLNLPLFHVFYKVGPDDQKVEFNVKMALAQTHMMMTRNSTWHEMFQFVYFTEGDSILHMRSQKHLYTLLSDKKWEGKVILAPHRMQTMPIPQNLPKNLKAISTWKRNALQDVELITEDATAISGSCCDDGKFVFKECGNFWYNCQMSGLVDIKTWIRFGKNGLTMSLTEHKGRCVYSSKRQLCAIPTECSIENSINPASISEICREVPSIWSSDPAVPSQVFDRRHQAPFNGGIFKDDEASVNSNVFGKNKKGFIGGKILHIPDNLR